MQSSKLSDCLYGMAVDGSISVSQQAILFRVIAKYLCKLTDGHVVRTHILRYGLEDYYYGSGNIQEKIETDYLVWRCVWDIVYNDLYSMEGMKDSAKFFGVDIDDAHFVIDNLYQSEFELIQIMDYDSREDFGKLDPIDIIDTHLIKRFDMLCRGKLRFLYQYDPGNAYSDWINEMRIEALKGFRRYDGECSSEEEMSKKMYSCAYSYVMEVIGSDEVNETKRIEKHPGGYRRKVLSLDYKQDRSEDTLFNHLYDTSNVEDINMHDNLDNISKRCSPSVCAYLKELCDSDELITDTQRLEKHNVSYEQVEEELRLIGIL